MQCAARKKKGASFKTRPVNQQSIGNCDSWTFIVGQASDRRTVKTSKLDALQGCNENLLTAYPQFLWIRLGTTGDGLWMAGGQSVRIPLLHATVTSIYLNRLIEALDFSCFGYESGLQAAIHRLVVCLCGICKYLCIGHMTHQLKGLKKNLKKA